MFKDKKPGKWILLAVLFLLIVFCFILFLGMRAEAAQKNISIQEITTPGGLTLWISPDKTLPIISVQFAFMDSGSALDPADRQGLARMLSNTLDEGAGELDAQAFQKQLADHSITLLYNASRDSFGGSLLTLTRHQEKAFELLKLSLTAPRFDSEALDRMRDANIARIRSSLTEPEWIAARLANDRGFEGHPYAQNNGGTISGLRKISSEDLKSFKETYLTRDRLVIAAAGDINIEQLSIAMDSVFGSLPASNANARKIENIDPPKNVGTHIFKKEIPQTYIEILFPGIDGKDPDQYAFDVMNYIFGGGGFGSRLMTEAREKNGLTYGIYSATQDYRHADTVSISTSTKNERILDMLKIIDNQVEKIKSTPVNETELADAKSYITGSLPLALTSTEKIASFILSLRMQELPIDYLDHFKERINAVKAEQITKVANRVFNPSRMSTVLVGKPQDIPGSVMIESLPNVE